MRITDIHIDGFGVWRDLTIRHLSPEVTAFYGPNEAGKTTLMQFLRSVLYGMSPERRRHYLPPFAGGTPGGWLGVDGDDGKLQIKRIADRGPSDVGKVTIVTSDGDKQGDRLLREALEHVDEVTFNNVFAVGLREIQELGALSGTAAAQWLYRLTSGLDRVSLYDVIHLLRGSLERLLNVPDEHSEIRDLLTRREALRDELDDLIAQGRRWTQSAVKLSELADDIQCLHDESKRLTAESRRLEIAINLKPLWMKREHVDEEIAGFDTLHPLPDTALAELDGLNERIEEHERQRDIFKGQRQQLHSEAEALGINELLQINSPRLIALEEQQEWLVALEREVNEAGEQIQVIEARLATEREELIERWLGEGAHAERITPELLDQLEPQAKVIAEAQHLLERAQAELANSQDSELEYRTKLESAAANADKLGLPADIQHVNDLVAQLRKRVQVEQRIEKNRREIRELEQQNYELVEGQMLPLRWFLLLLAITAISTASLGALWLDWLDPYPLLKPLAGWVWPVGAIGAPVSLFWKFVRERIAADRLEEWFFQIEDLEQDIQDAKREQKQLSQDLPVAEGSVKLRLQQAERHLAALEKSLPVESQRRAAQQEIEAAHHRLMQAEQKHEAAQQDWRNKLRMLGIAEDVNPADLDSIVHQYGQLDHLRDRAESGREDVQRRQRELATLTKRIVNLAEETGLELPDSTPLEQLSHLLETYREQKARLSHREGLEERAKALKEEERRHVGAAVGLARRRETLLEQCGVQTEPALRELSEAHAKCASLREKRRSISREIAAAIGRRATEEDFARLMTPEVVLRLESDWESANGRIEQIELELKQLLEERGRLVEQQRRLAEDRTLAHKQIQIDELDQQILQAKQAWRERAVAYLMLKRIRQEYERNRQPETLLEASHYMRQLTSGRYTRIWTPLAHDVLYLEKPDGQSLPVDVLSTGTREQLFVSLRLAMVAMFARRGIQLPLILDDVFVNFDAGRTKIAVQVLHDFSKQGHQLLVFTCHEHVWRMFQEIKADSRRLPDRFSDTVAEPATVDDEVTLAEPERAPLPVPEEAVAEPPPKHRKKKKRRRRPPRAPHPQLPEPLHEQPPDDAEPAIVPSAPAEYEYSTLGDTLDDDKGEVEYSWVESESDPVWDYLAEGPARPLPEPVIEPIDIVLEPVGNAADRYTGGDHLR